MDADVYWNNRLVGRLSDIEIDQPHYHGAWTPTGDEEFDRAFRAMQRQISPDGLGVADHPGICRISRPNRYLARNVCPSGQPAFLTRMV
jgi:hypothetical protein